MTAVATPGVSVVVPTYRRRAALERCLQALRGQDWPPADLEIVVVNDGGPTWQPPQGLDGVRVVHQANQGPAAARNRGAAVAKGRWLAFVDDDCAPEPPWLRRMIQPLVGCPEALVGGQTVNGLGDNVYAEASQLINSYLYERFNGDPDRARYLASNNLAVGKGAFLALGGFDEGFRTGEDRDLCRRWEASGRPMVYVADALVNHYHPLTLTRFWRQHLGYGRGSCRYRRRGAGETPAVRRLEGVRFYLDLLRYPLARARRRPWATTALVALAQGATAAGYALEILAGEDPP
ncbi:MAG: glycosyltransferase family 2 protein [Candidatus Competibacterales bacterium]